ncbi:unnamed protein product [Microthlaspi erraticum]|uniref:HSF-type DNA-binding domain-containing protein n=1 Tax=Microthlaspi erraticum TaxID=1685480 RepID=A0A6D2HFV4_9BRAS|nr:unnamed protein product [Microthlaspi erraticum]
MDENNGASSSLPPFLTKTYEMVDDSSSDSVVSWSENSKSFIVKNPAEFSRDLLPRFFKHKNFSSFIRQLNTYGFRKIDPEKWEFANDDFVRGQPYLMKNIHRRKPVHSHSLQNLAAHHSPLTESERRSMKDQIERLRKEKEVLVADLQSQEQERKAFEVQVAALKDRLQHMEQRQRSIVSFVSQVLEKPGLSLNLETGQRKRRLQESSSLPPSSRSHAEQVEKLESSLTFWEDLVTGVESSSMDLDVNETTTSCAESLSVGDNRPKSTKIDMNSEPVAAPKTGVNDVFWEQCLTENPGSIEQQEVQSERRDHGGDKIGDQRTYWWNSKSVNNIAEKT